MTALLFKLVGGIGLFLLGMALLTDGLKALAGDALRRALVRFTGTPWKAFGSGALVTALVQSSSATTVTVIGFVSAGLLTFPQAVGVVLGASLGTTGTGWIVAVLGLKVSVGFYALPLVGVGAFLKLLTRGRGQSLGLALAGFGLIFIGIETLQDAMQGLSGTFQLSAMPSAGFLSHVLMILIGLALTVVMQSSSAAVATTLTALHTGSVNFEQAASLVIGAAIGTTVTGALAAIGANVSAKRTALAHVVFNAATGVVAVLLLPLFLRAIQAAQDHLGLDPGATSLAAFHTTFILVGVALFLPFVNRFARAIERMIPEKGPILTRHLDDTLHNVPAVALEATRRAAIDTAGVMLDQLLERLARPPSALVHGREAQTQQALDRLQDFIARIPRGVENEPMSKSRIAQMHAIDHLLRLHARLQPPPAWTRVAAHPELQATLAAAREVLESGRRGLRGEAEEGWVQTVERRALNLAERRRQARPAVLRQTAESGENPAVALEALDAMRWLESLGYHTWRICNYLVGEGKVEPQSEVQDMRVDSELGEQR